MSVIDALIKVKKQAKTDDLIRLLDEVVTYEKLSKMEAFKDLRTSNVAQKKVPLLSAAYQQDMYALSMITIVGHILRYLEDDIPAIVTELESSISQKTRTRLLILQESLTHTQYLPLQEYDHGRMRNQVIAVFNNPRGDKTAILIVVKEDDAYRIYQGYYKHKSNAVVSKTLEPHRIENEQVALSILTYSIQGNNAYPFGTFYKDNKRYDVILPRHDSLLLQEIQTGESFTIPLSMEQRNRLNLAKAQVESFAEVLLQIIQEGGM